mmetsp:Transcript_11137/g.33387  ORF Transcript_11137/g.33387 Transcript_11137/m.33387 type:complete len:178 (+) Transcript_11137:528-1061(+)
MPGDWICANCGNSNFAKRRECRRCNAPRTSQCRVVDDRSVQADRAQDRRPRAKAVVPGDWYCGRCGNHNFQWRDACKRCGAPKAADSQVVGADQSSPSGPSPSGVPPSSRRDSDVPVPLSTSAPPAIELPPSLREGGVDEDEQDVAPEDDSSKRPAADDPDSEPAAKRPKQPDLDKL